MQIEKFTSLGNALIGLEIVKGTSTSYHCETLKTGLRLKFWRFWFVFYLIVWLRFIYLFILCGIQNIFPGHSLQQHLNLHLYPRI